MGQNQSQSASTDSPDKRDGKLEESDIDQHYRSRSALHSESDSESDSNGNRAVLDSAQLQSLAALPHEEQALAPFAFSSQVPGATQNLDPQLRSRHGHAKRVHGYQGGSSTSPRPSSVSFAKDEIAESPDRFVPPSPRADSPELNVSPPRAQALDSEAPAYHQSDDLAHLSSSQLLAEGESPEARRQRKLAKKARRGSRNSQQPVQAATNMADTAFDNHGLDALTVLDHQAGSYQLAAPLSDDQAVTSDNLPSVKPAKKKKGKKSKSSENVPQEQQTPSDGDLNQLVAFTNSSFPANATVEVIDQVDDSSAPTSKKRRKSATGDESEKKKKKKVKSQHVEIEEPYALMHPTDESMLEIPDQHMKDNIESPTVSKKKRKSKAKHQNVPLVQAEQMQVDTSYTNGTDHGILYGIHDESANDIPSYQPEPVSPYNPGHMSLDEIARAISSTNIQASYGAPNIPIDPALAKYENTQDHGDLLTSQHYGSGLPIHGLDVPMDNQHMHLQYGNYEATPMDAADMDSHVNSTPITASETVAKNSSRKRVAKPDFFSRVSEHFAELPSPSAARVSPAVEHRQPPANTQDGDSRNASVSEKVELPDYKTQDSLRPAMRAPKANILTGPFSDLELRNITEAIEKWRDEHNMTQFDINAFIHGNPKDVNSSEFWNRVIGTCPNRRRQKVINQCRRKFHNFVARGTWTPEQHEELSRMWDMHGNKYTLIGSLINRHPEDVRDRIRNYVVCGENRRKDAWSQEEEDRLANIVAEAIDAIRRMREKYNPNGEVSDEELVDWQMVSEKMDRTRSRLQCITKWKLIKAQLEGGAMDGEVLSLEQIIDKARREAEGMTDRDRYNVVKAIKSCGAQADSRIPWAKVRAEKVGDKWSRATLMLVWHRLKVTVPDWKIQSVAAIADYLCHSYGETNKLQFPAAEHLNLDDEYEEIERKVSKIIKAHNRPKTSSHLVDQEDLDDDVGAMEGSQFPPDDISKPIANGHENDSASATQSQLEDPTEEQTPNSHQDVEMSADAADSHEEALLPDTNGYHASADFDEVAPEQGDPGQLADQASIDAMAQAVVENAINAGFDVRKTPKHNKTYSGSSKKTPSSMRSEAASLARRSAKKASQRSRKAEAADPTEDKDDGSSNSSGSDDEDIPARV